MSEPISAADIEAKFRQDFPDPCGPSSLRHDLEEAFAVGSDASTLKEEQAELHGRAMKAITDGQPDAPFLDDAYAEALAGDPPSTLTVAGIERTNGSHHMTRLEIEQFARYGIVRHHFTTIEDGHFNRLGAQFDNLYENLLISSTTSWMYDPDILELVLNQELIERAESLLGDQLTFLSVDGPMYLPPNSEIWTEWHSASGRDFGGGDATTNLDHLSCWIAFTDATIENGCMKMVPGSFRANGLKDRLLDYTTWDADVDKVVATFKAQRYRFREDYLSKLLARRIGYLNHKELYYVDGDGNPNNYNGFHSVVDRDMAMGEAHLGLLGQYEPIALQAKRGDLLMFTSQNTHASFRNTSDRWRKAVSLRFVKTRAASHTDANHHHDELVEYTQRFPRVKALFEKAGKSVDMFKDTLPRLLIKGEMPKGQEDLYFDADFLRRELAGGHLLVEE